jgi:hypothetical protein
MGRGVYLGAGGNRAAVAIRVVGPPWTPQLRYRPCAQSHASWAKKPSNLPFERARDLESLMETSEIMR